MGSLGQKVDFMQICKSTSAELNGVLNLECVSLKMEFSIQSRQTFLIVALKLSQKDLRLSQLDPKSPIHPSIHPYSDPLILTKVAGGALAFPSCLQAAGA